MANLHEIKLTPIYLYSQYQNNELLEGFVGVVNEFIQETYIDGIFRSIKEAVNFREELIVNIMFASYALELFGINPPLSGAALSQFYDTGLQYDNNVIFDSVVENQGAVDILSYQKLLKCVADYSEPIANLEYFVNLAAFWTGDNPLEYKINLTEDDLVISLPPSTSAQEFVKFFQANKDSMQLPLGVSIDYIIKTS